jgi:ankyrin repeat protein
MAVAFVERFQRMSINDRSVVDEETSLIAPKITLLELFQKINRVPKSERERAASSITSDMIDDYIRGNNDVNACDDNKHSPLHYAAKLNRSDLVERLLLRGAKIDAQGSTGYTALHISSVNGHVQNVQVLLKNNANPSIKCLSDEQFLALHLACKYGHVQIVKLLLPVTDNPLQNTLKGYSAISLAAEGGFTEIVTVITRYVT